MTLTPAQHEARAGRLGGSDCAPALGLSRFKTMLQLYLEKRGELQVDREETEEMWFGKAIEPVVRQWFCERTGRAIRLPTETLYHKQHDFMVAHIDGFSEAGGGGYRGYEGKSAMRAVGWGIENTDQVPVDAYMQVQHYMLVTGFPVFDVVCLVGRRFKTYEVSADAELHGYILAGEREFMERVREGIAPPLECHHATALDLVKRIYPGTDGRTIVATPEAIEWRNEMEEAAAMEHEAKKVKQTYRTALLNLMGSAALLQFPDGRSLRRQLVEKAAYEVPANSYIDVRLIKTPVAA